jgi:hypothetical protein
LGRSRFEASPANSCKTPSQPIKSLVWWCVPVIPARGSVNSGPGRPRHKREPLSQK